MYYKLRLLERQIAGYFLLWLSNQCVILEEVACKPNFPNDGMIRLIKPTLILYHSKRRAYATHA